MLQRCSFLFMLHFLQFHNSSESRWIMFVDTSVNYNRTSMLVTKSQKVDCVHLDVVFRGRNVSSFIQVTKAITRFLPAVWVIHVFSGGCQTVAAQPVWLLPYSFDPTLSPWLSCIQNGRRISVTRYCKGSHVCGKALLCQSTIAGHTDQVRFIDFG